MAQIETVQKRSPNLFKVFLSLLSAAGICLAAYLIYDYYTSTFIMLSNKGSELLQIAVLAFILSLSRSLPLPTRKGEGFDICLIILYASTVLKGPNITVMIIIISAFFSFPRWDGKKVSHIFNTDLSKTLFNNCNLIIAVYLGWLVYHATGGYAHIEKGIFSPLLFYKDIVPAIVFYFMTMVVNSTFMAVLFNLMSGSPFLQVLVSRFLSVLPTMLTLTPIGYFLAYFFTLKDNGIYFSLLFFIPLLFARYAFKLYMDSKEQYIKTISTLTAAIEAKDKYTEGHSRRVEQYSVEIASHMGMKAARIENIKVAAVLHDIGKIGIEDEILRKPSKLTEEEWARIMQHPSIGIKILEEVDMPSAVKDMIQYHHVRFDLKGYPSVSPTKDIPMEVHVISLADAYDAMTSNRPYRSAMADEVALQNIVEGRGTQFHPDVVDVFLTMKKNGGSR